jgi:hypothetical protein
LDTVIALGLALSAFARRRRRTMKN